MISFGCSAGRGVKIRPAVPILRQVRIAAFVAAVLSVSAAPRALPCGFEDPSSITSLRGGLALAYPQALHVGTAVWQGQLAGRLPRDPFAQRADLSPEQRGTLRLAMARVSLARLADRLGEAPASNGGPAIALVLVGPVLWSRLEPASASVALQLHASGPRDGDVVIVTDLPVVDAIGRGELDVADAIAAGWLRFYGAAVRVEAARAWLRRAVTKLENAEKDA